MTLNGIMALTLHCYAKFVRFKANYVILVEAGTTLSGKNVAQRIPFWQHMTSGHKLACWPPTTSISDATPMIEHENLRC